jgi:DNA-binding response OmpR family regulator
MDILIVEDDETLRLIIARSLAARGHRITEAPTAAEAVKLAEKAQPDLLLLDINLPDRSGWDVLRELKAREINVPFIIISAVRVSPARLEEFRPLAYLPKPFPLEALLRLVEGAPVAQEERI